jgi:type IV fimbrial biogenesis protein FimT
MRGFSLIEMLVTVAVLVVALAIAAPGLSGFVRGSQLRGSQSEIVSTMVLARSEADKRGAQVAVAASAPASSAEFSNGWTVFVDTNTNGSIDDGEQVIRDYPPRRNQVGVSTAGGEVVVSFQPSGFLAGTAPVVFRVCGSGSTHRGHQVTLETVGLSDVREISCP